MTARIVLVLQSLHGCRVGHVPARVCLQSLLDLYPQSILARLTSGTLTDGALGMQAGCGCGYRRTPAAGLGLQDSAFTGAKDQEEPPQEHLGRAGPATLRQRCARHQRHSATEGCSKHFATKVILRTACCDKQDVEIYKYAMSVLCKASCCMSALAPCFSPPARAHRQILCVLKRAMAVQEIQQDLDAGNLGDIYVRDTDSAGGPDIPLSVLYATQQQEEESDEDHDRLAGAEAAAAGDLVAQSDLESLDHDSRLAEAELSGGGLHVSSMPDREEQPETFGSSADTDVAPIDDSTKASPRVRAEAEERGGPADREYERKKLAKQQELFGRSFSKPKRYALCLCLYETSGYCCWTAFPSCLRFAAQCMACVRSCCTL